MTLKERIQNWLKIGLQQPADRISEIFYYDKRVNEFFSILIKDYFMFDENLNIAKGTITTYTKKSLEILIDRIRRIENKDTTIISLPRLGNFPKVVDTKFSSQEADNFLSLNSVDIEKATIWTVEENVTIIIDLKNTAN